MSKIAIAMLTGALLSMTAGFETAEALNPQPLPPRKVQTVMTVKTYQPTGIHRLNPQPLPPG